MTLWTQKCIMIIIMNKDTSFQIWMTEKEAKAVRGQAKKLGLTVSAYIRMLIYRDQGGNLMKR